MARPPVCVAMVVDRCTRSSWFAMNCTLASLGAAALADIGEAPVTSAVRVGFMLATGDLWSCLLTIS